MKSKRHLAILAAALLAPAACTKAESSVKPDERVIFFPTAAWQHPATDTWTVPIHGWIFEPEADSAKRAAAIKLFRKHMGIAADDAAAPVLRRRAAAFIVDNERGKDLSVRIGEKTYPLGESAKNGHFRGTIRLSGDAIGQLRKDGHIADGWLTFRLASKVRGDRTFTGRVQLIGPEGVSVISDIDDTIKITHVTDRKALLTHTFCRPFAGVPGMAAVYRKWQKAGVSFHYVSASPWQLYEPLRNWLTADTFPTGSMHLKSFRWNDQTFLDLFEDSDVIKRPMIEALLRRYPRRRFILVGDAGEKDPELYGDLARRYPRQIARVLIRRQGEGPPSAPRLKAAFREVPPEKVTVFGDAAEIADRPPLGTHTPVTRPAADR